MSPFPTRLLGEDEEVILDLHPHWKRLIVPGLLVPVVVGVASYLVFLVPEGSVRSPLRWAVVAVALLLLLRWSVWRFLQWVTTRYVLTNRRVVIRTGVLSRAGRDIPLTRVNDVSFRHSVIDRMLGCGTLTIESAGENGQVVLPEVPSVELVQRQVLRRAEEESLRVSRASDAPLS